MADLTKRNAHPRDQHVSFHKETHAYAINGSSEGVTSVTTLLGTHFSEFDPDGVIGKYYGRWQQNRTNKYYGMSKEDIKKQWKLAGEEAIAQGNRLHAAIEAYYNGSEIDYDVGRKEWKHFLTFQGKYHLSAHSTEMVVWSGEHKLGGSIGLVAENSDGTYSIYDWKRCKDVVWKEERNFNRFGSGPLSMVRDNKYYRYSMQLNMYRELLERYYGYSVKSMHIVRLFPSARSFEVTNVERMEAETSGVLQKRRDHVLAESVLNKLDDLAI